MARRQREPIRVEAFVRTADGGEINIDELSPEKREEVGGKLLVTYMNALFLGKVVFRTETQSERRGK